MSLSPSLRELARRIFAVPTAPLHESHMARTVEAELDALDHVLHRRDEFGNIHAVYRHRPGRRGAAFTMVAHLDHPGFALRHEGKPRQTKFLGGVANEYFEGAAVEFYNEETTDVLGEGRIATVRQVDNERFAQLAAAPPRKATFAMWKLPQPSFGKSMVRARACDDLAGVITMLDVFRRLSESDAAVEVHALFTRAEEIGLLGALASLKPTPGLPKKAPVLSLETSLAKGYATMGDGPVLRVGDRRSIFTPTVTCWLENALQLKCCHSSPQPSPYQRRLMGGGTCEATVFCQAGLPTGALCLAMRNYHNMGPRAKISPEVVHPADWQLLANFLFFLATEATPYAPARQPELQPTLVRLQDHGTELLSQHPLRV